MGRLSIDDRRHAVWLAAVACLLVLAANHYGAGKVAAYRCQHHLPGVCATGVRR